MDKKLLIKRVEKLLDDRGLNIELDNKVSLTLSGSHASGMSTKQSDIDLNLIKLTTIDELLGLSPFDISKVVEGEDSINKGNDLDINIYSSRSFLKDLYYGEIIPNETLATDDEATIIKPMWMDDIKDNLSLFRSKRFLFKSIGYYKSARNRAIPKDMKKIKSGVRSDRILAYGYDTKEAERSIRILDVMDEYIENEHFNLRRANASYLKSVREGLLEKEVYVKYIDERYENLVDRVKSLDLREYPDEDEVNDFMIYFHKEWN